MRLAGWLAYPFKTNFMIFTNKNIDTNDIHIELAGSIIKEVSSLKFLGVIVDNRLLWTDHIDSVCNKISKSIGILIYKVGEGFWSCCGGANSTRYRCRRSSFAAFSCARNFTSKIKNSFPPEKLIA